MTTAGRPTWNPAKGITPDSRFPSKAYSSRDLRSHTTLKWRTQGQNAPEEIQKRDFKAELLEREQRHFIEKDKREQPEESDDEENQEEAPPLLLEAAKDEKSLLKKKNIDADDSDESDSADSDEENKSGSERDEEGNDADDTEELLKELERIRKEKEEEASRKEALEKAREAKEEEDQLLHGNPLINQEHNAPDFTIKKRWYDDTVFKNQAKGESKQQKRFINDTIRNDFHKKFLQRYIK